MKGASMTELSSLAGYGADDFGQFKPTKAPGWGERERSQQEADPKETEKGESEKREWPPTDKVED
jgi:hypothetical protein